MPVDITPGRRRGALSGCRSREPREEDTGHVTSTRMNMPMITILSNASAYMPAMRTTQGLVSMTDLVSRPREYRSAGRFRVGWCNCAGGGKECGSARGESGATGANAGAFAGGTRSERGREECAQPVSVADIGAGHEAANGIVVIADVRFVHTETKLTSIVKLLFLNV